MAFTDFPNQQQGVQLLRRSLLRGRLGHAYLFTGDAMEPLEGLAAGLAKTLNCQDPVRENGVAVDSCDQCVACRKVDHGNHPDVHWVRAESKLRVIRIGQIARRPQSPPRVMREFVGMKPTEGRYKVGIIVAADRMEGPAANAFLKTLEEPPADSVLVLLSTEPQRLLETITSRCLRLNFAGEGLRRLASDKMQWLSNFSAMAATEQKSLMGRYRLMDVLLQKLNETKAAIEKDLTARSPLEQYKEAESDLVETWEKELAAAIEAEYRRQRSELISLLQAWLRDVWIQTSVYGARHTPSANTEAERADSDSRQPELLNFPELEATRKVAARISPEDAGENLSTIEQLQRWLYTNAQEALALEVGLLKLRL